MGGCKVVQYGDDILQNNLSENYTHGIEVLSLIDNRMSPKFVANTSPPGNCRMAIPKKGRLYDKVAEMLKGAGIEYRREDRLDVACCRDLPLTLIFLPASDIATYVGEGNVDIGITGIDCIEESEACVEKLIDLGVGKCNLCLQAPIVNNIQSPEDLAGKRIVTSFPVLTKKFFDPIDERKGVKTHVKFVSGSVEAACGLGLADAVVDLVETGTTMRAAGLEIVVDILKTEVREDISMERKQKYLRFFS